MGTAPDIFEPKQRFAGAPLVCVRTNYLAFQTEKQIGAWLEVNAPGTIVQIKWLCRACLQYHFHGHGTGPSGGSSGTSRKCRVPRHIHELVAETRLVSV